MKFEYYVNDEKRMPTPEESQKLLDKMMGVLGYKKRESPYVMMEQKKEAVPV